MNDEYKTDDNNDLANSLIKEEPDKAKKDGRFREDENAEDHEFDNVAMTVFQVLKEDFGRQLELLSGRQNTMVQSIGIILAFASVLLIESIRMISTNSDNLFDLISMASLFACCLTCIATIWEWKSWSLYIGLESDKVVDAFNDWNYVSLYEMLLAGVLQSHKATKRNNYILKKRISYVVMLLLTGTVFAVIGMVIQ